MSSPMPRRARITRFVQTDRPTTEPVTKFGGQPVWLGEPSWPLSASTGEPLMFVGQIDLTAEPFASQPFPDARPRLALLFVANGDDRAPVWDPEAGENAVILQPDGEPPPTTTAQRAEGPALTLREWAADLAPGTDPDGRCEFTVETVLEEEPAYDEGRAGDEGYYDAMAVDKIGGAPLWYQDEELDPADWRLVLQLADTSTPFLVNFGTGMGYAFVDADGRRGRFLFQC